MNATPKTAMAGIDKRTTPSTDERVQSVTEGEKYVE